MSHSPTSKTVLVTGGAGFIGAHTGRALIDRGDTVVLIDDFNNRYDPALKEARIKHLFATPPTLIRADIRDRHQINDIFAHHPITHVVHLAAWASVQPSIKDPYTYTSANVDGTVVILEAARQHNVQQFVFASSSSVYGGRTTVPFHERDPVNRPISPYAATKAAGELLCATWHHLYQLPITCLRFFTVYGSWGRPDMAPFLFTDAIYHGRPITMRGRDTKRDFTYIDDIVQGVIAAVDKPQDFAIFNLGNNEAIALPRFIAAIEQALGRQATVEEVPLPPGDIATTLADITAAKEKLGYNPHTSIEEGMAHVAQWYQSQYLPLINQNQ